MKPFTIDEKKVFGVLVGELGANEATKLTPAWKHFEKEYLEGFDPLDHFNEIIKGLSDNEDRQNIIEATVKNNPSWSSDDGIWFDYLWIESHKPEILRAVLEVLEGE